MMSQPPDADFVCCSVIEFGDGGEPSVMLLGRGTREECERVADLIPAALAALDALVAEIEQLREALEVIELGGAPATVIARDALLRAAGRDERAPRQANTARA